MFTTWRFFVGALALCLCLNLNASHTLPQGIDACIKISGLPTNAYRYTNILRRFIPGEKLEESLISYLSDLGYPDFEDLEPSSALGFFLSSKTETSPLRLAFIGVRFCSEASLKESLQAKGWTFYDYKGWSFISLASADLFDQALYKDAWIDYLNDSSASDLEASLCLSGLEEELEALYGYGVEVLPPGTLPDSIHSKRPLLQALKKELWSIDAAGISCHYLEAEDRLEFEQWFLPKYGSALESFVSQKAFTEKPLDAIPNLGSPIRIGLHLDPKALKVYLEYLQAVCYSLASFESPPHSPASDTQKLGLASDKGPSKLERMLEALPAYSQNNLAHKGSTVLAFCLQSLASFETTWDGNSLLDIDLQPAGIGPGFTVCMSGSFRKTDLFAIGQDQAHTIPAAIQSLNGYQQLAIESRLTPEALNVGAYSLTTLEFDLRPIETPDTSSEALAAKDSFLRSFILYSGFLDNSAIFSTHKHKTGYLLSKMELSFSNPVPPSEATPEDALALGDPNDPAPEAPTQQRILWLECDLLAFRPLGTSAEASVRSEQDSLLRGELNLRAKTAALSLSIPLEGLASLTQALKHQPCTVQPGPFILNTADTQLPIEVQAP